MTSCICEFTETCAGTGLLVCSGCGGDSCICGPCTRRGAARGETECSGCCDCEDRTRDLFAQDGDAEAVHDEGALAELNEKERRSMTMKDEEATAAIADAPDLAPVDAREIVELDPNELEPDPRNPRGPVGEKDVDDLLSIITRFGQRVPAIVRPKDGGHMVVLGHRRRVVAKIRGTKLRCVVEHLTDEQALALMLAEQGSSKAFDPFGESDAISELLRREGWTLQHVADALGKGVRWVALRANLRNLSPKVRTFVERKKLDWPVAWLEDLARLDPEAQDKLVTGETWHVENVRSQEGLDRLLGEQLHLIGKAPFDPSNPKLCPKRGSCATCPKTSLRSPGLFDDADVDPASPRALEKAICRDAVCWNEKRDAATKRKIADLKKDHPDAIVGKEGYRTPVPKGVQAVELGYWNPKVDAKTKGAKPAIVVTESGEVELAHVKPRTQPGGSAKARAKRDPAKPPAGEDPKKAAIAAKKEIEGRRRQAFLEELADAIAKAPTPSLKVVQGIALAYGFEADPELESVEGRQKLFAKGEAAAAKDFAALIWERVRERASDEGGIYLHSSKKDVDQELLWLSQLLELDERSIEAKVAKEIPLPKWIEKALPDSSTSEPKKGKGSKGDRTTPKGSGVEVVHLASSPNAKVKCGAKGVPGHLVTIHEPHVTCAACVRDGDRVCRGCKCTASTVAVAGRRWLEADLCSGCGGAQPAGKKADAKDAKKTKAKKA